MGVEGTVLGEYVRRSLKTGSFERGMQIARQMEDSGKVEKKEEGTVSHVCQIFLNEIAQRNLNWSTAKKYRLLLARLEAHAALRRVSLLRRIDIQFLREFRATWKDGPRAAGKKIERLRSFFKFNLQNGWVETNPAKLLQIPKVRAVC